MVDHFDPQLAEDVESGEAFACQVCHEFVSYDSHFCPDCHVGICDTCGKPLEAAEVGDRDFDCPEYMTCRECFAHKNGEPAPGPAPTVTNLIAALRNMLARKESKC